MKNKSNLIFLLMSLTRTIQLESLIQTIQLEYFIETIQLKPVSTSEYLGRDLTATVRVFIIKGERIPYINFRSAHLTWFIGQRTICFVTYSNYTVRKPKP